MQIQGEYTLNGPRDVVYDLLHDPNFLSKAIPGVQQMDKIEEDKYQATMQVGIGPIRGTFKGTVGLSEQQPPQSYRLDIEGQGGAGFMKGSGIVNLHEEADGSKTRIEYTGESEVGGRIAQVGQRLVESVARKIINDGLETLNDEVQKQSNQTS